MLLLPLAIIALFLVVVVPVLLKKKADVPNNTATGITHDLAKKSFTVSNGNGKTMTMYSEKPPSQDEIAKAFAEGGDAEAQDVLGDYYAQGSGVEKNLSEAAKWYRKAAEQGNVDAEIRLGICYDNGQGVLQDYDEAVKWYRAAAEQGNQWGQYDLGLCYQYGKSVSKDNTEALKWYRMAAEAGNGKAQKQIQELEQQILKEQMPSLIRAKWKQLYQGMSPAAVTQLLGKPDSVHDFGSNIGSWYYQYHDVAGLSFGSVSWSDGAVSGWNAP